MERVRVAAGLSVPEVATALTRCTATVLRYEAGKHTPPQAVLLAMARLYGCDPAALVGP
jgi:transcriptional regulator with XRE-family HTH domain